MLEASCDSKLVNTEDPEISAPEKSSSFKFKTATYRCKPLTISGGAKSSSTVLSAKILKATDVMDHLSIIEHALENKEIFNKFTQIVFKTLTHLKCYKPCAMQVLMRQSKEGNMTTVPHMEGKKEQFRALPSENAKTAAAHI
ncbi:hypothetical protein BJ741DRAFT_580775 [Chytriomyces cf. hyalinus JEL632]|nr:hypothetical protein BJ741DRAFT_580775 [Chytriomyces cf. hyalinus JEL632]